MTLDEHIRQLEAIQADLPGMLSDTAKNATLRAVEAAQDKTPPTADSLGGTNARTGELKQHWAADSRVQPQHQDGRYVTELNNDMEYASYVNDGHRMDKHFVPGLYLNETSGLLEYDPGKRGEAGMMVGTKTKYVEGLHMTDAATEAYKQTVKTEADALCRRIEEALK